MSKRFGSLVAGTTVVVLSMVLVCATRARAQMMPASTAPPTTTTAPSVPAEPTTPRGALKTLYNAMQDGDGARIRDLLLALTPTETKMVEAITHNAEAQAKFRRAAVTAFGEQKAKLLLGEAESATAAAMAQIDASTEQVDGEHATVKNDNPEQPPLGLSKVGVNWKIPVSEFAKGVDAQEVERQLPDQEFFAKLVEGFASDVASGKYKTAEEAGDAIKGQMMIEMMKRQGGGRQPTTGEAVPDAGGGAGAEPTTEPTTRPG